MPLKLAEVNEESRIKDAVKERQGVSLRESFNLELCQNPIWKTVDKSKWKTPRGISYEGQKGSSSNWHSLIGGTGTNRVALAGANAKKNRGGSW